MQIEDLVEVGIQLGSEGACGGGLAGADFAGEQTGEVGVETSMRR